MYTFLHTPPGGVYFQYFRYIRRQFVCEGIYIQETASRNHILAGYELFMSIYNLQTRTGLNNYYSVCLFRPPALSGPEYDIHMC